MPIAELDADPRGDTLLSLRDEFVEAFSKGPRTVIETPAAPHKEDTVAGIMQDEMTNEEGLEHLEVLLQLVAHFAWKSRDHETRLAAMDWICRAGTRHAKRHQDARLLNEQGGSR